MKLLVLLLLLSSCASTPEYETDEAPPWLADAVSFCGKKYLCGVGEAKSIKVADARARSEIAKVFQTEITTELKSSESFQTGSAVKENYLSEIIESSEQNLENVKILEHWKKTKTTEIYALAGLDKSATQKKIKEQLDPLVSQLNALFQTGKRSDLIRAKKIYPKLYPLLTQWRIVSDLDYIYSPKEKDFTKVAFEKFNAPVELSFSWEGNTDLKGTLKSYVKDLLIKSGYRLGLSIRRYSLKGSVTEKDLPIKLDGYIKKEYEMNLDVYRNEKLVGNIHHNLKTSGRNWGQLKERARLVFMNIIFENLENLNIN